MPASSLAARLGRRLALLRAVRSASDAWLFAGALVFAAVTPLLARAPLPRLRRLVTPAGQAAPAPDAVERTVRCVEAAMRFGQPLVRITCLTRGLTLYHFLRRSGVDVTLVFGAGYPEGRFAGHCWLERDGRPYLEEPNPFPTFAKVASF